jgi:Arc/MetJ-type ribon-helix-helix transcriptional regulator
MAKAMTLRLGDEQAAILEMVARTDEHSVSDVVREAIDRHIEERRADKDFQDRLRRIMEEDKAILDRLAR